MYLDLAGGDMHVACTHLDLAGGDMHVACTHLPYSMTQLLKVGQDKEYVDLVVSFDSGQSEDLPGPPVRYYIK